VLLRPRSVPTTIVSFSVLLVLAVCGSDTTELSVSRDRPKIGYAVTNTTANFSHQISTGFFAGAEIADGVDATVVGPHTTNARTQVDLFRELTTTAKDGVAVSASAQALFARPLADASAMGIPLIATASSPPGAGVRLLVENDNYQLGRMLADETIKHLPPHSNGKIILGTHTPAHPSLDQRAMGMRDQIAAKLPNVRIMGPFETHQDQRANLATWQLLVAANPDAVAFLGTGDTDTISLAALRRTTDTWLAGGLSVDPHALEAVNDGRLFAVVSPEHFLKGLTTGWLLAQHAKGMRPLPEGWLVTPGLPINASNVDEIIQRQSSKAAEVAWTKPHLDRITSSPKQFLRPLASPR
jgi:ribose transport system substrate-binding protein